MERVIGNRRWRTPPGWAPVR